MTSKAWIILSALVLVGSAASLINDAGATISGPGCCVCLDPSLNSTAATSGAAGGSCFDTSVGDRECGTLCGGISVFFNATSCSDPSLADACGTASTMAPASSPTGLVALIAALAGIGAFLLRRRSLQD